MKPHLHVLPLAIVFAASVVGQCFGHSAIEPVPRNDEWWQRRHATMNTNVARLGEQAQVIFIGDSITQGWEGEGKQVWESRYAPRNAINLGIGGDRTQHVLWRLANGNLKGLKPKAAVVMIGTNNSNGEDNTIVQIAEGITAIVNKLREALPDTRVLLLPIFPRSENPTAQRAKLHHVNQIIQKLADGEKVIWVDFGHKFIRADGSIPTDLMPDFLHLSPKGYAIWADSIEPYLAKILGETKSTASEQSISGAWVATMPGPGNEPVDVNLTLKESAGQITGEFDRPNGAKIPVENGRRSGDQLKWTVKRDRPDGTIMTYDMSADIQNGRLVGKATTTIEGNPVTIDWSAKRR